LAFAPNAAAMSNPVLTVTNLKVAFDKNVVIDDLSFTVDAGDTVAVIGPNGAGKTVLFHTLIGLLPHTGHIEWAPDVKIGYVPQKLYVGNDIPLTVKEFFHLKSTHPHEIKRVLDSVGFTAGQEKLLKQKLGTLSGGQLQRVLIAWALVGHPTVLLFDEPTTGVDVSAEESIYSLLRRLQLEEKLTIILISHELQVVYRYATNVLCLNREGICFGPPSQTLTPETLTRLFGENTAIYHHQHQL
jgi:zinc transport system ATP-binding protein